MANVHLHHYPASPFSEKVRALLGYLELEWYSVETSIIMPRPLLMPLSGGYRRTPVADFSVYHPLWFLRNNPVNAPMVEAYPFVMRWIDRMQACGQRGRVTPCDGEAALAAAKATEPRPLESVAIGVDAAPGDTVRVTPTDVARVAVEGELVRADAQEFALRRTTDETGAVVTHFPRTGFALEKA